MTILYISSLVLLAGVLVGTVILIRQSFIYTIDGLRTENKELRDRLFQKHALPPTGVDLTEKYEERQEKQRTQQEEQKGKKQSLGPIERLTDRWTQSDRALAEHRNVDVTQSKKIN